MSLDESLSNVERAKLAVWDYPVSDKFSKVASNLVSRFIQIWLDLDKNAGIWSAKHNRRRDRSSTDVYICESRLRFYWYVDSNLIITNIFLAKQKRGVWLMGKVRSKTI